MATSKLKRTSREIRLETEYERVIETATRYEISQEMIKFLLAQRQIIPITFRELSADCQAVEVGFVQAPYVLDEEQ